MSDYDPIPDLSSRPGVPLCVESCPAHDGKRCRITGSRPDSICEPEVARDRARLASRAVVAEREIEGAQRLLTQFGVAEQMSPFKTPLAPLSYRLRRLNALRDQETYLAARAQASHANDMACLRAEIECLSRLVADLVDALKPLAALAPAYCDLVIDGAAIVTVQASDPYDARNVQLMPAHAVAAAAAVAKAEGKP